MHIEKTKAKRKCYACGDMIPKDTLIVVRPYRDNFDRFKKQSYCMKHSIYETECEIEKNKLLIKTYEQYIKILQQQER